MTRKKGDRVLIGDDVVITVVELGRGKLRLGFEAPKGVKIVRAELVGRERGEEDEKKV